MRAVGEAGCVRGACHGRAVGEQAQRGQVPVPEEVPADRDANLVAAMATGWIVTVIGGYALRWTWTGYPGHTLWDWLGMLLPLVFPAILLPPLLKWVSGNAAGRASAAYQTAMARTAIAAAGTSP